MHTYRIQGTRLALAPETEADALERFAAVVASRRFTLGEQTEELEARVARRTGADHAVAVSSGTAALEMIFRALDVAGRSVVIPTNTFFATAEAAYRAGARVNLADVDDFLLLNRGVLEILPVDTAAVVLVHIAGMVTPDAMQIAGECRARGIPMVEDAAHALGSEVPIAPAGSLGTAAAISLYPTKIVTGGEGGVVTTNDPSIARNARTMRDQGKAQFDEDVHVMHGYSWRIGELHAALANAHLGQLDEALATKRRVAGVYDVALAASGLRTLPEPDGFLWNRHKYLAVLPSAEACVSFREALAQSGVQLSKEVFSVPLHEQPVFRGWSRPLPRAEELCRTHVCLPIYGDMTDEEAGVVVDAVLDAAGGIDA